jgi:hypothetical protein
VSCRLPTLEKAQLPAGSEFGAAFIFGDYPILLKLYQAPKHMFMIPNCAIVN